MQSVNQVDLRAKERAELIAQANLSPRYRRLDRLDRYVDGTQYEGRAGWYNDDVPLLERAPCIVYPIAERAIFSHVDMVLGETRWPLISTGISEDDAEFDPDMGLSDDDSAVADRFIQGIVKESELRSASDCLLTNGMRCGTAVAVCCVRYGKTAVDAVPAKWCEPKFGPDGEVASLEIRYPYVEEFYDAEHSRWSSRCMLYRRRIDALADITFLPAPASETGIDPDTWVPDPAHTIQHDLGFCPVVWYPHMLRQATAGSYDGVALHDKLLGEIDALNRSFSQYDRAALLTGNPTIVETGTDGPVAPKGRQAIWVDGDPENMRNWVGYTSGYGKMGRKTGPGAVWTYADDHSKVAYLTLPAGALETLEKNGNRLLAMLRESMAFVESDPEHSKIGGGELSGKALEWLHQKQVDRDNKIREDFGEKCLKPLVAMLLRIALVKGRDVRGGVYLPGLKKALPIFAKFEKQLAANDGGIAGTRWFAPHMTLVWGPYFSLTEADAKMAQERVIAALDAGLITKQIAIETLKPFYPTIQDVEQLLEALEKEKKEAAEAMHEAQAALAATAEPEEEEPASQPPKAMNGAPAKKPVEEEAAA